jgi:UDP-N-acetylmuramoyl-tripeptide--D-alanyl-D-alanine ligase
MEMVRAAGVTVLNDSYNANPDSVRAALQTLSSVRTTGKRIAVLGDMKELGDHTGIEHERMCEEAERFGVDYLLAFGEAMRFCKRDRGSMVVLRYDQKNMLAEELVELVVPGDTVLVKGSRGMRMEDVVTFLLESLQTRGG